jgi:hypothetical protein
MATPWEDSVKNRNPKQLTVFATTNVKGPWRRAFNDSLVEFNRLSQRNNLGITIAAPQNATAPDPSNEDGADIQFDLGNGTIAFKAFDQDFSTDDFSGTGLHGLTQLVSRQFGNQAKRARRAFIFVPENPLIEAALRVGPDDFKHIQRPVGNGIRVFIAVHEFIHACGLGGEDHTVLGPGADILIAQPQPSAGAFGKPEDDKLLLHLAHPKPNVFSPPIFLKAPTADKIRDNWK